MSDIPTVKFDASMVTEAVKADLKKNILLLEEIDKNNFQKVYDAALLSISAGRDLRLLFDVLMQTNINGMTKRRAGQIASLLNNRATALMQRARQEALGIAQAKWLYSGAPCKLNPKIPSDQDNRQDAAHRFANGKSFYINKGMFLDDKWTWPGVEPGCRCVTKPIIPGFS